MIKIYHYHQCDTCRRALRFLDLRGIEYRLLPIRETPPSKTELKMMLKHLDGDLKKLFNTSGQDYRAFDIKSKLPHMTPEQVVNLLAENGNLVKRPFVLGPGFGVVGFRGDNWEKLF